MIKTFQHTICLTLILTGSSRCFAATTIFTEDFADSANWLTGSFTAPTEVAAGGPDGSSYVSLDAAFADVGQGTIYRGHDGFNASGDAFVGDWIANEYQQLTAFVRHSAPVPLGYFARLATPNNFPAAGVVSFMPVQPNTWTPITFGITRNSPQIVTFEGSDYDTVFSNIGNVQLAISVPDGLEADTRVFSFDLDKVALVGVPEPNTALLLSIGGLATAGFRRRKR